MPNQFIKDLKLIHCPICAEAGKRVVVGGTDDQGVFTIKRYGKNPAYTKVHSEHYAIECSECNEVIFVHKKL